MNAVTFVRKLEARGVRFETLGGRLFVDAPKGALSVEEVEGPRRHKADLLAVLAPATIASEPISHLPSDNQGEERAESGDAPPAARIPADVRAEIQRIGA